MGDKFRYSISNEKKVVSQTISDNTEVPEITQLWVMMQQSSREAQITILLKDNHLDGNQV